MKKKTIATFLLTFLLTLVFSTTVFAEETQQATTTTMYATANVNVRSGDSASTKKIGSLTKGQAIAVTSAKTESGWYTVDFNGQTGYVSGKYLTANNAPAASAPATTPTASTSTTSSAVTDGTIKTFSNGEILIARGQTPNGLTVWYTQNDNGVWPDYILTALDATGITNDMSDYDKAVAINNYICSVVDYGDIGVDDRALYSACLTYGKANCVGFSHAFACLCTASGVYTNQVVGEANGATHAWNSVYTDSAKYWVDVTYNDASNNAYLMSTEQFSDHEFGYEN